MKATLYGVQKIDFTASNGEKIEGWNIFVGFPEAHVDGVKTQKLYVRNGISMPKDVKLNDEIEISFNYKGKVEKIQKA